MEFSVTAAVKARRSVRTFDGRAIKDEDRIALTEYIRTVQNPFSVPVEFRLLNAAEYNLSSPVIVGADEFLAAKVVRCKNFELAYGYSFESVCLFAQSLGLGTVMLAASLSRKTFEKTMELKDNEVMPVASPVGYPAAKMSLRESLMRKALRADSRIDFDKLFYDCDFDKGLSIDKAGVFAQALEMARWAPSGVNRQPLRAVVCKDTVHFYETGSTQKLDIGIALAHFDLTLKEEGISGSFVDEKPMIALPKQMEYVISYKKS